MFFRRILAGWDRKGQKSAPTHISELGPVPFFAVFDANPGTPRPVSVPEKPKFPFPGRREALFVPGSLVYYLLFR